MIFLGPFYQVRLHFSGDFSLEVVFLPNDFVDHRFNVLEHGCFFLDLFQAEFLDCLDHVFFGDSQQIRPGCLDSSPVSDEPFADESGLFSLDRFKLGDGPEDVAHRTFVGFFIGELLLVQELLVLVLLAFQVLVQALFDLGHVQPCDGSGTLEVLFHAFQRLNLVTQLQVLSVGAGFQKEKL